MLKFFRKIVCGQKPTFFSILYIYLNFSMHISSKKKWESGQKCRKPLKIQGFLLAIFVAKNFLWPFFLAKIALFSEKVTNCNRFAHFFLAIAHFLSKFLANFWISINSFWISINSFWISINSFWISNNVHHFLRFLIFGYPLIVFGYPINRAFFAFFNFWISNNSPHF